MYPQQVNGQHQAVCCGQMLDRRDTTQRDLDRLERWTHANFLKFNNAECKVLHLGKDNPKHKNRLG